MAKFKWKKRAVAAMAVALSAVFTLGVFSACSDGATSEEDEETTTSATDTQLIKNGNFEFYTEKEETDRDAKVNFINSPTSWSLTAGTPSSNTRSGIIDTEEWSYLTQSGREFTSVEDALAHWNDEDVTLYDRLKFYEEFEIEDADDFELYDDYAYSIDFEDVENLYRVGDAVLLHDEEAQRENGDTNILMIHNENSSNDVVGTGQYYTSGTTITLDAGTAAEVSVWVKTAELYHYYANASDEEGADPAVPVTQRAGAYIGVTQTVGGSTLEQMQIKNINTAGVTENNGWVQYTVHIRANTYATSTFRIVLGLGQSSTSDRYEAVNGYAFFDDLTCKIISSADFDTATRTSQMCTITSTAEDKLFDVSGSTYKGDIGFAIDLSTALVETPIAADQATYGLTKETSGSRTYTSADIDASLNDNTGDGAYDSITKTMTVGEIKNSSNQYLRQIAGSDFTNYPFGGDDSSVIMLLSSNGAAYTARLPLFTMQPKTNMIVSFYVKTSEILTGRSGASAVLIDGENKTRISAFDSTTIDTVDIDDDRQDIYDGWVHCMFFVRNETEEVKSYAIELTYGATTIVGTQKSAYGQGYAAFTNLTTCELNNTLMGYASGSTGSQALSVSLTSRIEDETKFDDVSAVSASDLENGKLGKPASFTGVVSGSKNVGGSGENVVPADVKTGLLNAAYADLYVADDADELYGQLAGAAGVDMTTGSVFWQGLFGSVSNPAKTATQPLIIYNAGTSAAPSYGYFADEATISADSYQRISMRVKVSEGAVATIYLTDRSDVKTGSGTRLAPNAPAITYWYDDDGNICAVDPASEEFDDKTDILFYLEENGLYRSADTSDTAYYANLHNYEESSGDLLTKDGTVAFYGNENKYYAYRDEDDAGNYSYRQEVVCLPTEVNGVSIVRYDMSAAAANYESVIRVVGTAANAGEWIEVSFYVHTGDEAKTYRLEVWAGARDNATDGIPAGGYVFFDNYVSADASSNYDSLRDEAVATVREATGTAIGENLPAAYALYYTFTFYDSVSYLRYDVNEDEDELGNPYGSYAQSAYEEQLIFLLCDDTTSSTAGFPSYSLFLDYTATDVTPAQDDLGSDDGSSDTDTDSTGSDTNIWLVLSSGVLAVVLLFAIVAIIVRRVMKKRAKEGRRKSAAKATRRPAARIRPAGEDSDSDSDE